MNISVNTFKYIGFQHDLWEHSCWLYNEMIFSKFLQVEIQSYLT